MPTQERSMSVGESISLAFAVFIIGLLSVICFKSMIEDLSTDSKPAVAEKPEWKKFQDQYWQNLAQHLAAANFTGEHKLVKRPDAMILLHGTLNASSEGGLFFSAINTSMSVSSDPNLQFWWEQRPGEILLTTLPTSELRLIIDNSKRAPTIEFVISGDHWKYGSRGVCYDGVRQCIANEIYFLPPRDRNFNQDIMSEDLQEARIRISARDLKREIFLLKFRK